MTRINCIEPKYLKDKHLVAEYRELPRVFGLIEKAIERGENPKAPKFNRSYIMGKGHLHFFYNKGSPASDLWSLKPL